MEISEIRRPEIAKDECKVVCGDGISEKQPSKISLGRLESLAPGCKGTPRWRQPTAARAASTLGKFHLARQPKMVSQNVVE